MPGKQASGHLKNLKEGILEILPAQRRRLGMASETLALRFLRRQGMELLVRNYHCRTGEIDLIVRSGGTIVFVEVRFRKNSHYGSPIESVTPAKQTKIVRCARHYLMRNPQLGSCNYRFDIIGISQNGSIKGFQIEWLKNAFEPGL